MKPTVSPQTTSIIRRYVVETTTRLCPVHTNDFTVVSADCQRGNYRCWYAHSSFHYLFLRSLLSIKFKHAARYCVLRAAILLLYACVCHPYSSCIQFTLVYVNTTSGVLAFYLVPGRLTLVSLIFSHAHFCTQLEQVSITSQASMAAEGLKFDSQTT